jgi:hypothetical protein
MLWEKMESKIKILTSFHIQPNGKKGNKQDIGETFERL